MTTTNNDAPQGLSSLSLMVDDSTGTWMPFDDEDWGVPDGEAPHWRSQVLSSNDSLATDASASQGSSDASVSEVGCQPSGTISRQSLVSLSDHAVTPRRSSKAQSTKQSQKGSKSKAHSSSKRKSQSLHSRSVQGFDDLSWSRNASVTSDRKSSQDQRESPEHSSRGTRSKLHKGKQAHANRKEAREKSSSRRELIKTISHKEEKPKSHRRSDSDKALGRECKEAEPPSRRNASQSARRRSLLQSQRSRRNLSMRGEPQIALERQPSTRVLRSDRRKHKQPPRKSQSLQAGFKLSDEAIHRMGLNKAKMSDFGPQLPSASAHITASERLATSTKQIAAPFRRTKSDAPHSRGLPRRSFTSGRSNAAGASSSALEEKVSRMKELSKSYHKSGALLAASNMEREVPLLRRTGAKSA